ncbi:unnamed protein product [Rhizophagus irregularis]|nr:unnamed protein product [Rhizophagus irregularis]CAB4445294.1 unnamed protein product [Rhizophagus irregularis]CAB4445312.1 unnamed protein product [Rhizophagus irregularis]CAB4445314.1 unnamed protein product [Rhizophagus irregularis]CAB4446963.1 unnamed protein product [Rhizophagus irregularis]
MNDELTEIIVDQQLTLDKESDLTLGFDGWTSPRVKGGNLKSYVKTRWSTAWDCTSSILRLENQLKNLLNECPEILNNEIKVTCFIHTTEVKGCERVFSIIGWMANKRRTRLNVEKLESMAKLHTYYITNAKSELKFAYNTLSEDQFQNEVRETFSNPSFFDDDDVDSDYDDDEDNDQNEDEDDDANGTGKYWKRQGTVLGTSGNTRERSGNTGERSETLGNGREKERSWGLRETLGNGLRDFRE